MPIQSTPQAISFLKQSAESLGLLWGRWHDEQKYEDINDYAKPLEPIAAACGVQIEKMTKHPFGCIFTVKVDAEVRRFTLTCNNRGLIEYKRIG